VGCECAIGLVEGRCFLCSVLHDLGIERGGRVGVGVSGGGLWC
jgi:hypothetical protein